MGCFRFFRGLPCHNLDKSKIQDQPRNQPALGSYGPWTIPRTYTMMRPTTLLGLMLLVGVASTASVVGLEDPVVQLFRGASTTSTTTTETEQSNATRTRRSFVEMVPMRDGVELHTRFLVPRGVELVAGANLTVVLDRSPYGQGGIEVRGVDRGECDGAMRRDVAYRRVCGD